MDEIAGGCAPCTSSGQQGSGILLGLIALTVCIGLAVVYWQRAIVYRQLKPILPLWHRVRESIGKMRLKLKIILTVR